MDPQEYLRRSSPLALRWALVQRFQQHHINDLAHVIKLVQENGKDIPKSQVQKSGKIDNGSFGSIFKATYKGRLFVMKCIGQGDGGPANLREAIHPVFLELCAVVALEHPRVVRFEGMVSFFPDETQREQAELGFLFEYCENGNVYDNLFKKRTLSKLKLRLFLGCQIAEGMSYLHDESIIHRDLNSMNVVLTKDMNAKICDFGCARRIGAQGHITPTTISGSPSYMSPEQLTGAAQLTLKSDVWAMAVVLWELVGMQSPWVSIVPDVNDYTALTQLIVKQRKRLPPLPDAAVPDAVHPYLTKLLDKSFAEEPGSRPTMREFCNILQGMYNKLYPPPPPPPPAAPEIPGLQVLESTPSTSPALDSTAPAAGGVPALRKGASFSGSGYAAAAADAAGGAGHEAHRKRAHPAAAGGGDTLAAQALDLAEAGPVPGDCEPRGICPVCGTQVTTAHRGRMRNSMGTYFHARCWESAQDVHADADPGAPPPPPRGAGHPSTDAGGSAAPQGAAAAARGNFRGVCPICGLDVTAAHEGRRVDARGNYLHAQCWDSYDTGLAPPPGGGGGGGYGGGGGGGGYGGGGEHDYGGEVRLM